jgi:hypothetical protein
MTAGDQKRDLARLASCITRRTERAGSLLIAGVLGFAGRLCGIHQSTSILPPPLRGLHFPENGFNGKNSR